MEFAEIVKKHAEKAKMLKGSINTEEATKTSLIMPFFQQVLGYDVFDPNEFCPEYIADVGIKKGEKIDYAIINNGTPTILIEAKWCGEPLDKHSGQLFRYFGVSKARFGILTNGIVYKFYTDLEEANKMDLKPFLEIDLLNLKDGAVAELKKFHKSNFSIEKISSTAANLKYFTAIENYLAEQFNEPSNDFIRFIVSNVYDGRATQSVIEKFTPIIKKSLSEFIEEAVSSRIKIMSENIKPKEVPEDTTDVTPTEKEELASKIVTTEKEIECYYAIKYCLHDILGGNEITYKDTESYFGILLNGNTRKWICRLRLDGQKKVLAIADKDKNEVRYTLNSPEDVFNYRAELIEAVKRYIPQETQTANA